LLVEWQEKEGTVPVDQTFRNIEAILDVKTPVNIRRFDIRYAGRMPDGKGRKPPYVEVSNGDVLPLKVVGWEEGGFRLQAEEGQPFMVPSERITSIWFP